MNSRYPTLLVVLGMHRSGTSAITRGLTVLGVDLGSNLMPPSFGVNEKGFFEDLDLNRLNIEMLEAVGADWDSLSAPKTGFVDTLRDKGFLLRAVDMVREKVAINRCFGFKDPRVTQLLPFWKEVFERCEVELGYVLAIRNPISVAKSLQRRDQFDFEKSILLWLSHVLTMLENTAVCKGRIVIDYDRLLESPEREMNRMGKVFDREVDLLELSKYERDFLDAELRHAVYAADDVYLDAFAESVTKGLYKHLLSVASDEIDLNDRELQVEIASRRLELNRWVYPCKLIDKLVALKRSQSSQLSEARIGAARNELEVWKPEVTSFESGLSGATAASNAKLAELVAYGGIVESQLKERERWIEQLKQESAQSKDRLAELSRINLQLQSDNRELNRNLLSQIEQLEKSGAIIDELGKKTTQSQQAIDDRERRIESLEHSIALKDQEIAIRNHSAKLRDLRVMELEMTVAAREREVKRIIAASVPEVSNLDGEGAFPELSELLARDGIQFVESAFQLVLGRPPDQQPLQSFLRQLQEGTSKIRILSKLMKADEARLHKNPIPGMRRAIAISRLAHIPIIGYFARYAAVFESDSASDRRIRGLEQRLYAHHRRIESDFERVRDEISSIRALILRTENRPLE
jgi:hypothetical protein